MGLKQRLDLRRLQLLPQDNLEIQLKLSVSLLGCSRATGHPAPCSHGWGALERPPQAQAR